MAEDGEPISGIFKISRKPVRSPAELAVGERGGVVARQERGYRHRINAAPRATKEKQSVSRPDCWATTSNKQLNFPAAHPFLLKIGGRAAVVLPDNVLFEGGAGAIIRERLLQDCNVHTILRLPTGIFYAQGVKANVVYFGRRAASSEPATKELWVYDFPTNEHFTLKTAMKRTDLDDFVAAFKPRRPFSEREESERFKKWTYKELAKRDGFNLDIWAKSRTSP